MTAERATWMESRGGIGPATVTAIVSATRVSVTRGAGGGSQHATLATSGPYAPRAGDTVLVAQSDAGDLYVIGVITALRLIDEEVDEPVIVRDRSGRPLFEHHASSGKSVVHAPEGDLELRADHGSVNVVARDVVTVRGDKRVDVSTPSLTTTAGRAEVFVGDARLVAKSLRSMVETARHTAGVLEVEAKRIVERAKCTYRDVEELAQTRAGRMRSVVESTFHVLSKTAVIKAEEDVKLKGKKIHLA